MRKYIYKLMILGIFLSGSFAFGQFNTIKPTISKKSDSENSVDPKKLDEAESQKENKQKKSLKKTFGITTKADLKNQIDSLKILIKESSLSNNQKRNNQNPKDCLIGQSQFENPIDKRRRNAVPKFDFVEEQQEYSPKIVMALNRKIAVTSPYGTRTHPMSGTLKFHNGIDLAAHYENVYSRSESHTSELQSRENLVCR